MPAVIAKIGRRCYSNGYKNCALWEAIIANLITEFPILYFFRNFTWDFFLEEVKFSKDWGASWGEEAVKLISSDASELSLAWFSLVEL